MKIIAPWAKYLDIIALKPVKILGINPMVLSAPWDDSLMIIALQRVKQLLGINPMGNSAPWDDSLEIIALDIVNKNGYILTQRALVTLRPTNLILLTCSQ